MIRELSTMSTLIAAGRIRLGMTRNELHDLLGPPEKEGGTSGKYTISSIYMYGDVQFVFAQARTAADCEKQGLQYVYVDDSLEELEEPLFLLR
jgi:hypothetical protein